MTAIPRETEERLKSYHELLLKWQDKINLISPSTVPQAWERHFVDSLQLLPHIPESAKTLYDLGSGGGFPGLVLAIARPDIAVTLIESDAKKCAFLAAVSRETGVAIKIENARIEDVTAHLPAPDVVSARALKSLSALCGLIMPWALANPDMVALFPKGAANEAEIEEAKMAGFLFHMEQAVSGTDPAARILTVKNLRRTG